MPCRRRIGVETTSIQESILHTRVGTLLGTGNSINLDNPENFTTLELHRGQPKPFGWINKNSICSIH
jgi:hypothetical protein